MSFSTKFRDTRNDIVRKFLVRANFSFYGSDPNVTFVDSKALRLLWSRVLEFVFLQKR